MTRESLKQYLVSDAKILNLNTKILDKRVEQAIGLGLNKFVAAWKWYWRKKQVDLVLASGALKTALPSNIGMLITVNESTSQYGTPLEFVMKDQFDEAYPKMDNVTVGVPQIYTVYDDDKTTYIVTAPPPNQATTLQLNFLLGGSAEVDFVPDEFFSGLLMACQVFLFTAGSPQRRNAMIEYQDELSELIKRNKRVESGPPAFERGRGVRRHGRNWTNLWIGC